MSDLRLRELERRYRETGAPADARAWLSARLRARRDPRLGLVFLDDLASFAPWNRSHGLPWREDRDLDGPLLPPTLSPPPIVVAVASRTAPLEPHRDWLQLAAHPILVTERVLEASRLFDDSTQIVSSLSAPPLDAIDQALHSAQSLTDGVQPWSWLPNLRVRDATPPGPWLGLARPQGFARYLLTEAMLARGLCWRDDAPAFLHPDTGELYDLGRGVVQAGPTFPDATLRAPSPDLRGCLLHARSRGVGWAEAAGEPRYTSRQHDLPIGVDPAERAAWAGGRCMFSWYARTPQGVAYWTPSNHDWPCGHGKKLFGYKDNDPLWVHLSPDGERCLSVYEHDTLITPGLPVRWRDLGDLALAERHHDEPRALLFQHDPDSGYPADPLEADEDAREHYAQVSLGPDDDACYVVGLSRPTYRLCQGVTSSLGGPEDVWVVYDRHHSERARYPGRWLAGWDRWVVYLRDGRVWRHDLRRDLSEDLGEPGRPITHALAVPNSPNAVPAHCPTSGPCSLRVV